MSVVFKERTFKKESFRLLTGNQSLFYIASIRERRKDTNLVHLIKGVGWVTL